MYEDPQDMFMEMDTLFSQLFAKMTRDFAAGENRAFRLSHDYAGK